MEKRRKIKAQQLASTVGVYYERKMRDKHNNSPAQILDQHSPTVNSVKYITSRCAAAITLALGLHVWTKGPAGMLMHAVP